MQLPNVNKVETLRKHSSLQQNCPMTYLQKGLSAQHEALRQTEAEHMLMTPFAYLLILRSQPVPFTLHMIA